MLPIHLPHAHRKVAVAEASAADIAIDLNIVRRIAENQIDAFAPKKRRISAGVARVSTDEFVPPEYPNARARNRWPVVPIGRNYVFDRGIRTVGCAVACLVQYDIDLGQREAGKFDIEHKVDQTL